MTNAEFEIFVVRCRDKMLATASRYLAKDSAEDVVQEALLKLFAMRDRLTDSGSVDALAMVVVKHLALNTLRYKGRHPMVELKPYMSPDDEADTNGIDIRAVLDVVDSLPSKQQMVFRLKHIEAMEVEEIATVAMMRVDAVYQNLSRARRNILEQFKTRQRE